MNNHPLHPPAAQNPDSSDSAESDLLQARHAALMMLCDILDRRQALDTVLERNEYYRALPDHRERGFARMIVSTVLRRCGQIDDFIAKAMTQAEPPHPPMLRHLLRLGAAQIAFMNVPDYAAIDTAVNLAARESMSRQKGLVNAVLRRIAGDYQDMAAKQDAPRLNTPDWLMRLWIADYGLRTAAEIAQANLAEAPLDITLRDAKDRATWAQALGGAILPTGSIRIGDHKGGIRTLPGFEDGQWWVQDAAAALPATLFGDVTNKQLVDLCAAPGGKTAQLVAAGAQVIAIDHSVQRLKRLAENMERLGMTDHVRVEAADAAVWRGKDPVSHILLDAPCSATGTIRRHPDVLHLKKESDITRLAAIQDKMLNHACDLLAPGGLLVYCTCSLQKAEGENRIAQLLEMRHDVRRVPVRPEELGGQQNFITPEGDVRILPFYLAAHGGMDGFFAARLQKT